MKSKKYLTEVEAYEWISADRNKLTRLLRMLKNDCGVLTINITGNGEFPSKTENEFYFSEYFAGLSNGDYPAGQIVEDYQLECSGNIINALIEAIEKSLSYSRKSHVEGLRAMANKIESGENYE